MTTDTLPDLLGPGLRIVFCGTQAGHRSAARGCYYAGPGNKFWPTLAQVGLTPRQLRPEEYEMLLSFGIGLTDLAKKTSGPDADLRHGDFDVAAFRNRVLAVSPRFVAFNGKRAAAVFLGCRTDQVPVGSLGTHLGSSALFALPSTSGAAAGHWSVGPWAALARVASDCQR